MQGVADRLRVMAAVRFVDYVTVFEEDTPLELILALQPDVIVKGADYSAEAVVGAEDSESLTVAMRRRMGLEPSTAEEAIVVG